MSKSTLLQDPISRDQLREQIRQSVRDAQVAAQEAAQAQAAARQAAEEAGQTGTLAPLPPLPPLPPGITHVGIPSREEMIPPQVESISIAFFVMVAAVIIGLPLMRAIARRIERGTPVAAPIPQEVRDQLQQISQSVDAIAIEVERISEGQRFTTKMLSERKQQVSELAGGQ